jgi:hypothetical protein
MSFQYIHMTQHNTAGQAWSNSAARLTWLWRSCRPPWRRTWTRCRASSWRSPPSSAAGWDPPQITCAPSSAPSPGRYSPDPREGIASAGHQNLAPFSSDPSELTTACSLQNLNVCRNHGWFAWWYSIWSCCSPLSDWGGAPTSSSSSCFLLVSSIASYAVI